MDIARLKEERLKTQPAKIAVRSPPSGIRTLAETLSKISKRVPDQRHKIDATIAIKVDNLALCLREMLCCSWKYSVITSWNVIVEVSAAIAISRKKIADHNSGIDISLKTNGKVSNISVGPCVGFKPSTLNTAGKIIIPDKIATKKVIIDADQAVVERFVPRLK